mgnify:CR=1 FL=1
MIALVVVLCLTGVSAAAGEVSKVDSIVGDDTNVHDAFGGSVDIDGDYVVVGAETADCQDTGNEEVNTQRSTCGAAYVFQRRVVIRGFPPFTYRSEHYEQIAKLVARDEGNQQGFGASVAIDDGTIVVGAPKNGDGAAYVYHSPWRGIMTEDVVLNAPTEYGTSNREFRQAVDIDGNTIVIGAPGHKQTVNDPESQTRQGAIFVYKKVREFSLEACRFLNPMTSNIVVGCLLTAVNGPTSVITVEQSGRISDITGDGSLAYRGNLGISVALLGSYVFSGSSEAQFYVEPSITSTSGAIYRCIHTKYIRSGSSYCSEIQHPDYRSVDTGNGFGSVIAAGRQLGEGAIVIGAPHQNCDRQARVTSEATEPNISNCGAAYYAGEKLNPGAVLSSNAHFGASVAAAGPLAIVGAPHQECAHASEVAPWETQCGAVYLFSSLRSEWTTAEHTLHLGEQAKNSSFGSAVAAEEHPTGYGYVFAVGASMASMESCRRSPNAQSDCGAVHIYRYRNSPLERIDLAIRQTEACVQNIYQCIIGRSATPLGFGD